MPDDPLVPPNAARPALHPPPRTNHRGRSANVDIGNAEKKLRQADFFLSHLEVIAPREIARSLAGAGSDQSELLDYYFSACLSAAQSVFYTLREVAGPRFKAIEQEWRRALADDNERARFNGMIGQRDRDVHSGETDAQSLPALMPADSQDFNLYVQHNSALLGPPALATHINPDGTAVKGASLRGTKRLYLVLNGVRVDAATACRVFIAQLNSLYSAVKTAIT